MGTRIRLDDHLVALGLAPTRSQARVLIMAGKVRVGTTPARKGGQLVASDAEITVDAPMAFVSRGGLKLVHALDHFQIDPQDMIALDCGASTGGFTDVLLQRAVQRVFAVDVGYGQLAWSIRTDPRVTVMERTNLRLMPADALGMPMDLVVLDLSFISLTKVLPAVANLLAEHAKIVTLIKPQFEVGKGEVGKGGIVREPALRERAVDQVVSAATALTWTHHGTIASPIQGADGNVEFLAYFSVPR